jgi:hypothetical protein
MTGIAFRKGSDSKFGALIRLRTASKYSHCEVVITGGIGEKSKCIGASAPLNAVRVEVINLKPENWDFVPVHIKGERLAKLTKSEVGKPYDYFGALAWGTPFADDVESKGKWFCSELAAYALGIPEPWRYSPGSLHSVLTDILN